MVEAPLYPVIIHCDGDLWGYSSPEFGGGGATTYEDARSRAQELVNSAVRSFEGQLQKLPLPSRLDQIDAADGQVVWLSAQ